MPEQMNEPVWCRLWSAPALASVDGTIARRLSSYAAAIASEQTAGESLREAAEFFEQLSENLEGLDRLHSDYRNNFGLPSEEFPARTDIDLGTAGLKELAIRGLVRFGQYPDPVKPTENEPKEPNQAETNSDRVAEAPAKEGSNHEPKKAEAKPQPPTPTDKPPSPALSWSSSVADALQRRGDYKKALTYRSVLANSGAESQDNITAMGELLERLGRFPDAMRQYELLREGSPRDPEAQSRIARVLYQTGHADRARAIVTRLLSSAGTRPDSLEKDVTRMLLVAQVLAIGPAVPGLTELVRDATSRVIQYQPQFGLAHLASGYVFLADNDPAQAKERFAYASALISRGLSFPPVAETYREVIDRHLAFARAYIQSATSPDAQIQVVTDPKRLQLIHARALKQNQVAFSVLRDFEAAVSAYSTGDIAETYEVYKGFAIVFHRQRYYAVPRSVVDFVFIDGVVCRVGTVGLWPIWVRKCARWLRSLGVTGAVDRIGTDLQRLRRARNVVRGVKVAERRESLIADIDREAPRTA